MSEKYAVVYNTSTNTITYDDYGRCVAPQEWAAVEISKVVGHISREELIVVPVEGINEMSNENALAAKKQYELLAESEIRKQPKNDYDGDPKPDSEPQHPLKASETKTTKTTRR